MAELVLPTIPVQIVVHLGTEGSEAPNISVGFLDYIANVASNEIYPTWPESAIVANVIAQASFALNRVYTEFYRSKGYDYDITSSPASDQTYDPTGSVFENVREIAGRYFNSYIRRVGSVEPLYALYCDGNVTQCAGLSQYGSRDLAEQGFEAVEILRYYYGDDIELVTDVPVATEEVEIALPLDLGSVGNSVFDVQHRLNRISVNYPAIPKIPVEDGIFGEETARSVREFQKIFNLPQTGIVDDATWYQIRGIFNAVKKLNELFSEGLTFEDVSLQYPEYLSEGDSGVYVSIIQYYLNFVSAFTTDFTDIPINGVYDGATVEQVKNFQIYAGLVPTGIMDVDTWNVLFDIYIGIVENLPENADEGAARPFPGITLRFGNSGDDVLLLQQYINTLAEFYDTVPQISEDGIFGSETRDAVYAVQSLFDLTLDGAVDAITWAVIADEYETIRKGLLENEDQFPGYLIERGEGQ